MSAPDRAACAAPASRCACTNITLIQLFHELKQKFPAAPDHVVSAAITAYRHDKRACELHLERHAASSLAPPTAYHASSSAAARSLRGLDPSLTPVECQNRLVDRRQYLAASDVTSLSTEKPQNAKLSHVTLDDNSNIETVDYTKQLCNDSNDERDINKNITDKIYKFDNSPVTINIDNCIEKSAESPSDFEETDEASNQTKLNSEAAVSSNYKIFKSNKIPSNLNTKLDKSNEDIDKSSEKKSEIGLNEKLDIVKPKRPCTLEFIKPQVSARTSQKTTHEEAPKSTERQSDIPETVTPVTQWVEPSYPLNLSVNVNCRMDFANRPGAHYPDRWIDEYDSPRAFTSVNLTVCTPTSAAMQSPASEVRSGDREFEGHVTVTVSPSTARAPRRRAPPPPPHQLQSTPTIDRSAAIPDKLIAHQLARKSRLVEELARERESLARVVRETAVLTAAPPTPEAALFLRRQVEWLREQCQQLLDSAQNTDRGDYYPPNQRETRSPLPSRPAPPPPAEAPSWQCQICTFKNHGLLNKCEVCDMPCILLVRPGDEITVRVVPGSGRRKIVRSWLL